MRAMGGHYVETTYRQEDAGPGDRAISLEADEWKEQLDGLAKQLDATADTLPVRKLGRLEETADAFVVRAILS
jgi:hypothetical protein